MVFSATREQRMMRIGMVTSQELLSVCVPFPTLIQGGFFENFVPLVLMALFTKLKSSLRMVALRS